MIAHLAVRRFAPTPTRTLLPLAALLQRVRLHHDLPARPRGADASVLAPTQALWTTVGVAAFVATLLLVPGEHPRALPLHLPASSASRRCSCRSSPGIGRRDQRRPPVGPRSGRSTSSRARRRRCCSSCSSPRTSSTSASCCVRQPPHRPAVPPRPEAPRPAAARRGASRSSSWCCRRTSGRRCLFFAVFAAMLYMATDRVVLPRSPGSVMFVRARSSSPTRCSATCRTTCRHVARPVADPPTKGYQLVQSPVRVRHAAGSQGTGLGLGEPDRRSPWRDRLHLRRHR